MKKVIPLVLFIFTLSQLFSQNVGVWNNTDGSLRLGTTSLEIMRVDANGNVGIGTSTPLATFDISGTSSTPTNVRLRIKNNATDGAADAVILNDAGKYISIASVGSAVTGSVYGINSANMSKLVASGNNFVIGTDNSVNSPLAFITNGAERMRITETGSVGIGTTNPGAKFHVTGGHIKLGGTGSDNRIYTYSQDNTIAAQLFAYDGIGGFVGTLTNHKFFVRTNDATRMVFDINGNVGIGIGTTSPTAKLEVNGTVKITDGTQGAGKVLTSDASGLASWQSPAGGGSAVVLDKSTTTVSVTGTLSETIVYSKLISANTISSGDILEIMARFSKTGVTGTGSFQYKIYFNTSPSIGGVTLIDYTFGGSTWDFGYSQSEKKIFVTSSTNFAMMTPTMAFTNDNGDRNLGSDPISNATVNLSVNNYIIITLKPNTASNTGYFRGYYLIKN
jgi:hypothetical protein